MIKKVCLFFCLLSSFGTYAQDQWSLERCINYGLENNIQIKQAELDSESAEVNLFGTKMSSLPSLNANAGMNYSVGRSIDPFTNTIIDSDITSQNGGLNASVPIFNGFQIRKSTQRDQQNALAANYSLEDTKNTVTLNVVTFYTNILFNNELLEVAKLRLLTTKIQENRISKQVELGSLPIADLLQIRQQLANDELAVIQADNNVELSALSLKQALQIPAEVDFSIQTPALPNPDDIAVLEKSSEIYLYALKNQPVIKAAEASQLSAQYGVGVAKSSYYPSLNANAGISTAYSSAAPDQLPALGAEQSVQNIPIGFVEGTNQTVLTQRAIPSEFRENTYMNQLDVNQRRFIGLSLNIPIFNRFQVNNAVSRAKISYERSSYQLINAKNQLQQTIEQAYLDVKTASKAYSALENSLEAAELAYENANQRLDLGAIDIVAFTQIKNDYERVKSDLVRAKYDFIFKTKVLDFYQGKPLNF
jgi:outer membrane protein